MQILTFFWKQKIILKYYQKFIDILQTLIIVKKI